MIVDNCINNCNCSLITDRAAVVVVGRCCTAILGQLYPLVIYPDQSSVYIMSSSPIAFMERRRLFVPYPKMGSLGAYVLLSPCNPFNALKFRWPGCRIRMYRLSGVLVWVDVHSMSCE